MTTEEKYPIIGQIIKTMRLATAEELESEGWETTGHLQVIVLENDVKIYPSRDYEGNGPGALFGEHPNKSKFGI